MYSVYWSRLRPLPGAARLLRACHKLGLRVILASSANPRELEVLRGALDADDAIDDATSAGDVGRSKPSPDLVEVALANAPARLRRALSSSATPSGMRKPAGGPVSHASASLPAARARPSSATPERAGLMLPLLAFWTPFPAAC